MCQHKYKYEIEKNLYGDFEIENRLKQNGYITQ